MSFNKIILIYLEEQIILELTLPSFPSFELQKVLIGIFEATI